MRVELVAQILSFFDVDNVEVILLRRSTREERPVLNPPSVGAGRRVNGRSRSSNFRNGLDDDLPDRAVSLDEKSLEEDVPTCKGTVTMVEDFEGDLLHQVFDYWNVMSLVLFTQAVDQPNQIFEYGVVVAMPRSVAVDNGILKVGNFVLKCKDVST